MDQTKTVHGLLKEKRKLFQEYEGATRALSSGEIEEAERQTEVRERLRGEIDTLDEALRAACGSDDAGRLLLGAATSKCDRDGLSTELKEIFDQAMEIRSIVGRIRDLEPETLHRLEKLQAETLEKVRELNQSNTAVASKYNTGGKRLDGPSTSGFRKI